MRYAVRCEQVYVVVQDLQQATGLVSSLCIKGKAVEVFPTVSAVTHKNTAAALAHLEITAALEAVEAA